MTSAGFQAPTAAMRDAADGIEALVGELGSLTTAGRAGEGRGVPGAELGPEQLGHDGLAAAFSSFCFRWDWGMRALVQDGTEMAEGLRESVESYARTDDGVGAAFSRMLGTVLGDPAADPVQNAEQPPGEILGGAARDYLSSERWSHAGESMSDTWAGVAQDVGATVEDRVRRAAAGENPYGAELDALREIVQ